MAVHALVSPGGSPGVTTTALALALAWPAPVVLAECDPACGDILAGLFAGHLTAPRGLLGVAFEAGRGPAAMAAELAGQLAPLDGSASRMFLAGLSDPRQAPGLSPAWPAVARTLAGYPSDVLADCGRLDAGDGQPVAVLAEAAMVLMVLRPSLRQIARARPRIEMITALPGGTGRLGLLLVGEGRYGAREVSTALGAPVVATLPLDARTAAVLSDGDGRRTGLTGRPLLRAAATAAAAIRKAAPAPAADQAGHLSRSSGGAGGAGGLPGWDVGAAGAGSVPARSMP